MSVYFTWPAAQHIYLSPHLDDAVLSCGGTIAQQVWRGETVAVITVFAGSPPSESPLSPFARSLHERWQASAPRGIDFTDPSAVRRAEDRRALAAISPAVQVIHLPLPECIYRLDPTSGEALYASEEAIFGEVLPTDPALNALRAVPPFPADAVLYAPLGVGHHVDHLLVRWAVASWKLPAGVVRYYEEYPYAEREAALQAALGGEEGWQARVSALDEQALAAKIGAVAHYVSQISTFWESAEAMEITLRRYVERVGGERLWVKGE